MTYHLESAVVMGRAWFFGDDDPEFELFDYELVSEGGRSGAEWCQEWLRESLTYERTRKFFNLPEEGDFQVLFKGTMHGNFYQEEWDDNFTLDECKTQAMKPIVQEVAHIIGTNHKVQLIELLTAFGLTGANQENPSMKEFAIRPNAVIIGSGDGYSGFYAAFEFKENGSFDSHGIWE